MPAEVNIKVGSLRGTSDEEGTIVRSFLAKYSRKVARTWLTLFMALLAETAEPLLARCPSAVHKRAAVCRADPGLPPARVAVRPRRAEAPGAAFSLPAEV